MEWISRSDALRGRRVVLAGDNIPLLSAFTKGRSSSQAIQAVCRRAAAYEYHGVNTRSPATWDPLILMYLHGLQRLGRGRSSSKLTISRSRHVLRGMPFPKSRAVMKAWARAVPARPHRAMSGAVNILLVKAAVERGWFSVAGWLRVSFICLLRVEAASRLLWSDVRLEDNVRFPDIPKGTFIYKMARLPDTVRVPAALTITLIWYSVPR